MLPSLLFKLLYGKNDCVWDLFDCHLCLYFSGNCTSQKFIFPAVPNTAILSNCAPWNKSFVHTEIGKNRRKVFYNRLLNIPFVERNDLQGRPNLEMYSTSSLSSNFYWCQVNYKIPQSGMFLAEIFSRKVLVEIATSASILS